MQFGIGLPNLSYVDPTETLMRLAHAAQDLAFDAIWVSDHVFMPYEYAPNYPYSTTGRVGCRRRIISSIPLPRCRFWLARSPRHAWELVC